MREKLKACPAPDRDGPADFRPRGRNGDRRAFGHRREGVRRRSRRAEAKAEEIARVARGMQGAEDLRIEKVSGQQYLSIDIDRQAMARWPQRGRCERLIETAIGGKAATEIFEGERRFPAVVRLPAEFATISRHRQPADHPGGAQARLADVAHIAVVDGPAQISREMAKRRIVVGINVKGRDLGGFVAELQKKVGAQVKLPEGYYLEWGGQFQNMSARWAT
jgi:cobalt-zinc-cadmium resistance protein CzcA